MRFAKIHHEVWIVGCALAVACASTDDAATAGEGGTADGGSTGAASGDSTSGASNTTMSSMSATGGADESTGASSVDGSTGGSASATDAGSTSADAGTSADTGNDGDGSSSSGGNDGGGSSTSGADDGPGESTGGVMEPCFAPGNLTPCDAATDDPFQAIGLDCPGGADEMIPLMDTSFTSPDPDAWKIARQLGTYIDPMTNDPLWSPSEGEQFLVISTGRINDPDMNGVITMINADVYDSSNNPDGDPMPAPASPLQGSNNGAGGTPFVNCDTVNDCSDTLEAQWNAGGGSCNDLLWFQFETPVPGGTHGFTFDFAYFSVEFPEYVNTVFNDIFLVWSNSETYTGNLCFVNDQPCTVTALWPIQFQEGAAETVGTGFQEAGGGTGWYQAKASTEPGELLQLTWAVFDMGDTVFDTLVIVDNWRWDCEGCVPNEVMGCGIEPDPQ
jgi:hypothetical protein